jgi:hypothetical protein
MWKRTSSAAAAAAANREEHATAEEQTQMNETTILFQTSVHRRCTLSAASTRIALSAPAHGPQTTPLKVVCSERIFWEHRTPEGLEATRLDSKEKDGRGRTSLTAPSALPLVPLSHSTVGSPMFVRLLPALRKQFLAFDSHAVLALSVLLRLSVAMIGSFPCCFSFFFVVCLFSAVFQLVVFFSRNSKAESRES